MKLTVEMDQAQLDDLKDRLAFINGGWERAVVRAMNTAASQARTKTAERARALLTADRQRIEDSLLVKKATYGARAARLHMQAVGKVAHADDEKHGIAAAPGHADHDRVADFEDRRLGHGGQARQHRLHPQAVAARRRILGRIASLGQHHQHPPRR